MCELLNISKFGENREETTKECEEVMCVCVSVSVCVYVYVCVCACVRAYVFVCIYVYLFIVIMCVPIDRGSAVVSIYQCAFLLGQFHRIHVCYIYM